MVQSLLGRFTGVTHITGNVLLFAHYHSDMFRLRTKTVSESKVIFTSSAGNQPIYQLADQCFLDFDFITQHSNYYIGFILA